MNPSCNNAKEGPDGQNRFFHRYGTWLVGAMIFLLTVALYAPVVGFEFLRWDDDRMLFENPQVSGLTADQLKWMFTNSTYNRVYMPLGWLGFAFTNLFVGTTSACHHAVGMALHAVNAVLVFSVLLALLSRCKGIRDPRFPLVELFAAGLAALLWAVHPLRVEAIAWVGARVHPQAGIFALMSVRLYLQATDGKSPDRFKSAFHALSILAYVASVASFPIAAMLPLCLLVVDYWFLSLRKSPSLTELFRLAAGKILFFAGVLPLLALSMAGRLHGDIFAKVPSLLEFGVFSRAMQAAYVYAVYLAAMIYPFDLSVVEPRLTDFNPLEPAFVASALAVIALTVGAVLVRRKYPSLLAAWLCYLIILLPFLGLSEHPHAAAYRYTYLNGVIWSALVAGGLAAAWRLVANVGVRSLGAAAAVAIIVLLGLTSHVQMLMWRNDLVFFGAMANQHGSGPFAADIHWRLGRALAERGRYDEAIAGIDRTLKRNPAHLTALNLKARVLLSQGKTEQADAGLMMYAEASWRQGKFSEALEVMRKLTANNPGLVRTKRFLNSGSGEPASSP